jgi:predicted enzyme involved in methoxymalonyl-ACP biosynthesis
MSCRVLGLEVEVAAVALAVESLGQQGAGIAFAAMVETERNLPCRDLYRRCGFQPAPGGWHHPTAPGLPLPPHIRLAAESEAMETAA